MFPVMPGHSNPYLKQGKSHPFLLTGGGTWLVLKKSIPDVSSVVSAAGFKLLLWQVQRNVIKRPTTSSPNAALGFWKLMFPIRRDVKASFYRQMMQYQ